MLSIVGRSLLLAVLASLNAPCAHADDVRVGQLELDIARLQRDIAAQARRIDQLERDLRMSAGSTRPGGTQRVGDTSPAWLVVGNWERVRPGMKELEVVSILGRPTTFREDAAAGTRTFFYAMELGPTSVLAGNVRLGKAGVVEVTRPALR